MVPERASGWRVALELLLALRSLVVLALLALVFIIAVGLARVPGSIDQRLSGAVQQTGRALTGAGQAIGDAFSPTHPPRYAISQDTEFNSLLTPSVGEGVGQSAEFTFTLKDVRRRDDAGGDADIAQYAILQRQYRAPRETKVLGITVHVDNGEQQYVLDKGETFRIAGQLYKVNWISVAERRMALGVYRSPDQFAGRLALDSN